MTRNVWPSNPPTGIRAYYIDGISVFPANPPTGVRSYYISGNYWYADGGGGKATYYTNGDDVYDFKGVRQFYITD